MASGERRATSTRRGGGRPHAIGQPRRRVDVAAVDAADATSRRAAACATPARSTIATADTISARTTRNDDDDDDDDDGGGGGGGHARALAARQRHVAAECARGSTLGARRLAVGGGGGGVSESMTQRRVAVIARSSSFAHRHLRELDEIR